MTVPTTSYLSRTLLILTDVSENANKYWEGILETNGVRCKWGRVGGSGQEKFYPGESSSKLLARVNEKKRKGYAEVALIEQTDNAPTAHATSQALAQVATAQIAQGDSELTALVTRLAEANRHEISVATGGAITFNAEGMAQTALGIVKKRSVVEARAYLFAISKAQLLQNLDSPETLQAIAAYLQLIPQKVGAKRGWHTQVFGTPELIEGQFDLLDKLEHSIVLAQKAVEEQREQQAASANDTPIFEVTLKRVHNKAEIRRIENLFKDSSNTRHVSSSLRIKAIYSLDIPAMRESYEKNGKNLGGIQELWHGTRIFNVLSILKSGLIIPKASDGHVTGRMFGDGLYFSDQSTKAANYAAGYWDGSFRRGEKQQCFMFLADVAMGRSYIPKGRVSAPPAGYNSVFAKAGQSGVQNNEMIVYALNQANLKYLVELEG